MPRAIALLLACSMLAGCGKKEEQPAPPPPLVTAATITGVMGLLDHGTRRLVADPYGRLRAIAEDTAAFDATIQPPEDGS